MVIKFSATPLALVEREDGLRFERSYKEGLLRCEACLELVPADKVREHVCREWWNDPVDYSKLGGPSENP